jgi:uncharacterized protein YndB with AHSA1/START domain
MDGEIQTGFLVAADVTGYTEFLTGSELDHSHDIMRGMMKVLSRALSQPLRIIKYEGDAILCYAPDAALRNTPLLLDLLEGTYLAFSDHLFNMKTCTTCTCKACGNLKGLDLKFFLHHGSFILEKRGKEHDLAGPDVILLHRLMKNHVKESSGLPAYVLATAAALDHLGRPAEFAAHVEHYEHFGAVPCGVADLKAMLERRRDVREVRVTRQDAQIVCEGIVAGAPSAVWDYFFDPEKRRRWDHSLKVVQRRRNGRGREGVGATMHCAHGSFASIGTTLDWKPFRYFTQQHVRDGGGPFPPPVTITIETEALPDGKTRVSQLVKASSNGAIHRLVVAMVRRSNELEGNRGLVRLDEVMRADAAATSAEPVTT